MKTAQIVNASCSRRALELAQVRDFLAGNGYSVSDDEWTIDKDADLILVSTCGFTQAAEDAGFSVLHRANREKKPSAHVVLCGCIPEINPERVQAEFRGPVCSAQSYGRLDTIVGAEKPFASFSRPNLPYRSKVPAVLRKDVTKVISILRTFDGSFSGLQEMARKLGNGVTRQLIRRDLAYIGNHRCPVKSRTESTGCQYRLSRYGSPYPEVPVKWAFPRTELG